VKIRKAYAGLAIHAVCNDCDRTWRGRNALAVGAIHARRYGHVVRGAWTTCVTYEPAPRAQTGAD